MVTADDGEANGGDEASMPSPFFADAQWSTGSADTAPRRYGAARAIGDRGGRCGCAAWCARRTARSATRCVTAPQRNWLAWPRQGCPGADPAAGTA